MPSILDALGEALGNDAIERIGQQLGTDPATTSSAVSSALPMLVTALAHKSSSGAGADALAGALAAHDGSVLDSLPSVLGGGGGGDVLGQVLGGGRAGALTTMLGQSSGLGQQGASQLLAMLAPLVLGALGKNMRDQGLDSTGLASMLGAEHGRIASTNAPLTSMLTQALDSNHDGSVVDDVMRIAGGLLGGSK